jgi:hypothetical protein
MAMKKAPDHQKPQEKISRGSFAFPKKNNFGRRDSSGIKAETVEEFLARGGKINKMISYEEIWTKKLKSPERIEAK